MKKLLLSCFLLFAVGSMAFAQTNSLAPKNTKAQGPNAVWEMNTHNFGEIPQGVPVSTTFTFTNTGSAPLIISDVKTSCGCTTPFYTKDPIMPGQEGVVKAQYNAAKAGTFNKSITVITNSSELPQKILYIKGSVVAK